MIKKHKYCTPPPNKEIKIWKYLNFAKFVDLLMNETLHFSRCDNFEDNFEGAISKQATIERNDQINKYSQTNTSAIDSQEMWHEFFEKIKKTFAANCWHMNEQESYAMWKVYLNNQDGIAIQSNYSRLFQCLQESTEPIYLSVVKYDDSNLNWGNYIDRFLHKRKNYQYEQELRAMIIKDDLNNNGVKIKINLNLLIENIYISPSSPEWFIDLVNQLIDKHNFKFKVDKSSMDIEPSH